MKTSEMNPRTILEIGFSTEQLEKISKLFSDAAMAINSIECEFNEVDKTNTAKYKLLVPNAEEFTLWMQLFGMEKLFREAAKISK